MEEEQDIEVAEASSLAMLKTLEVFAKDNPSNQNYAVLLAKSYGNFAFGFLENKMLQSKYQDPQKYEHYERRAKLFYERGKRYGLDYLKRKGRFRKAINSDALSFQQLVQKYGRSDMELLFWTAYCWGSAINLSKDDPEAIGDLPKVEIMMRRVLELQESYYNAAPHLFFGVYYASRPPLLGGIPARALEHFEEAQRLNKDAFLMVSVLEAQFYAVQIQDKALYQELLEKVLEAPVTLLPEQRLANELAKRRARILLDQADYYF